MHIPTIALGSAISGAILAVWDMAKRSYCESKSHKYDQAAFHDQLFKSSPVGYFYALIGVSVGVLFFFSPHTNWVIFLIGIIFILVGIAMVPITMTSGILVQDGSVTLIDCGRHKTSVKLSDIIEASENGKFFIMRTRSGEGRRMMPMGCSDDALLLAMLRHYRPQTTETDDT
jgi:hypothetical protein